MAGALSDPSGSPLGALLLRVPERALTNLGRAFFALWIGYRVYQLVTRPVMRASVDNLAIWILETSIYALMLWGYARRAPAFERASTTAEIVLPLAGGPFPFLLLQSPIHPIGNVHIGEALVFAGDVLAVLSYSFLGGSFSILVDARPLKSAGPYRWIRHPVYAAQILATLGLAVLRGSARNFVLWVVFVAIQATRARLEERKMLRSTPGYAEYQARTKMFVPFVA
jgi:protein-S-isoprenylcysteine O-methyltransferase Ste14